MRQQTTVAPVTRVIRGIRSQVEIDHRDGLTETSAINCDALVTISKTRLERRIGRLSASRLAEFHEALRFALQMS